MKIWQIIKAFLYLVIALFIFINNNAVLPYVGFLVGGVVCLYSLEELIVLACKRRFFKDTYHLFDGLAQLFIGIILFIVSKDVVKVCLVWGVWSILRETKEMSEAIDSLHERKYNVLSVIESLVIIALSFFMILEPNEEHAHLHVILLGAELVLVVVFYFLDLAFGKKLNNENTKYKKDITL